MKHSGSYEYIEGRALYDYTTAKSATVCPALGKDWHLPHDEEFANLKKMSGLTVNPENLRQSLHINSDMVKILGNLHGIRGWYPIVNGVTNNFPNGIWGKNTQ